MAEVAALQRIRRALNEWIAGADSLSRGWLQDSLQRQGRNLSSIRRRCTASHIALPQGGFLLLPLNKFGQNRLIAPQWGGFLLL